MCVDRCDAYKGMCTQTCTASINRCDAMHTQECVCLSIHVSCFVPRCVLMESSGVSVVMLPSTYELCVVCPMIEGWKDGMRGHGHTHPPWKQHKGIHSRATIPRDMNPRERSVAPKHRRLFVDLQQRLLPPAHAAALPPVLAPSTSTLPLDLVGDGPVAHGEDLVAACHCINYWILFWGGLCVSVWSVSQTAREREREGEIPRAAVRANDAPESVSMGPRHPVNFWRPPCPVNFICGVGILKGRA